jgi:conjugal transfer mating pair stabilization protein TraG
MEPVMPRWLPHRLPSSGAVALLLFVGALPSHALALSGTPWDSAARRHGLDPALLYAVALDATARPTSGDAIAPWPWTLRSGTDVHFYESRTAALIALRARAEAADDLDVGLIPVNLRRHTHRVGDPATLLDAGVNLVVATAILAEAIDSAPSDPALGIGRSRYPNDEGAARAYGQRMLRLRDALDRAPDGPVAGDVFDLWRTNAVLDLVAGPESRGHYNAWYRNAHQSKVQLADLTVNEVRALQRRLVRRHGGSAVGRYQIIDDTLDGLILRLGLAGDERFTPALQDRLARHLAREAGLDAWLAGALSDERFAANLARVWAGLPGDSSNRSVYEGIQGNRATVGWRTLVASLRQLRVDASEPQ